MIHTFTYKGIDVTVNTTTSQISFIEPGFSSVTTVWETGNFQRDKKNKVITSYFNSFKTDINGAVIPGTFTSKTVVNLNTKLNQNGIGQYDFFNDLMISNFTIGNVADLACLNNLLENLTELFEESIPCFNPYNNWSFFHPIELTAVATMASNNSNDGVITATVVTPYTSYNYSLNGISWQSSSVFSGLAPGEYSVYAKSTTELVPKQITITILQQD